MKITVSVGGRFHAFYLARELLKRGYLHRLITSYPKWAVKKYGIPPAKITSLVINEILQRLWFSRPNFIKGYYNPRFFISDLFDRQASKYINETDIFVGWSGFSLYSLKEAKSLKAITILERGSSHISFQERIVKEEFQKLGVRFNYVHPRIREKELLEYAEADYIEVPSSFAKKTFMDYGMNENKIIQSALGVDLSEFRNIPKEDNIFRIVYCGGFTLRKGLLYLLKAFYELDLSEAQLWLIGSLGPELKPFLKKYDNGRVYCKGPYPQKELYKYYSQGSVFVFPSLEDGFGLVILQAMACGLPVIATVNTAGPDIIRDGLDGFIIPIRDTNALKEKIFYFYSHPEACKAMGAQALAQVRANFTWGRYGERIAQTYLKLLNTKKG